MRIHMCIYILLIISSCQREENVLIIEFDTFEGLMVGDKVLKNGAHIGEVLDINRSKDFAKKYVTIKLFEEVEIPVKSEFKVSSIDIFGNKGIGIDFADTKRMYESYDTVVGHTEKTIPDSLIDRKIIELIGQKMNSTFSNCNCENLIKKDLSRFLRIAFEQVFGNQKIKLKAKLDSRFTHLSEYSMLEKITCFDGESNMLITGDLRENGMYINRCDFEHMSKTDNMLSQKLDKEFLDEHFSNEGDTVYTFSYPKVNCEGNVFLIRIQKQTENYSGGSEYIFYKDQEVWRHHVNMNYGSHY